MVTTVIVLAKSLITFINLKETELKNPEDKVRNVSKI
jgi:hypothetical protein